MVKSKKNDKLPDKIILEYQKAQDSAEHHDTMIWVLTPVLLGFSVYVLYLVYSNEEASIYLKIGLWIFGVFSLFYFSHLIESANEKKLLKYSICKEIEKNYNFIKKQHLQVEKLDLSGDNAKINGMAIMRIVKFILYFLYLFTLIFLYFGWKLNYNPSGILYLMLIIAISAGLYMEYFYMKKCPIKTGGNLKKKKG